MTLWRHSLATDHDRRLWSVLLLFVAAVILPTACVLWLIGNAISTQRHIVKQQLAEAYRSQLRLVRQRLDEHWQQQAARLGELADAGAPSKVFASAVTAGFADSVVVYGAGGRPAYPGTAAMPAINHPVSAAWQRAKQLEGPPHGQDLRAAASAYGEIAARETDPHLAARALQGQIRCLRQAGEAAAALALTFQHFMGTRYHSALDEQGRLIAGDQLLMAVQSTPASDPRRARAANVLRSLLIDYESGTMPAGQRLFLMKELRGVADFPTLPAEELATRALDAGMMPEFDGQLRASGPAGGWLIGSRNRRIVSLLRTATVERHMKRFVETQTLPPHVRVAVISRETDANSALDTVAAGDFMPEWKLALYTTGQQAYDELASRQMALYLWMGALVLVGVTAIAAVAGRSIHRQMRLASLKADLAATVSHELKTPLASMRLLVDTLLDAPDHDPVQVREYLELIDRENSRLTLLIENFLAFSRLERNKYSFHFAETSAEEIIDKAAEAFADRASEPNVRLDVNIEPGMPPLRADSSALSTVLINLLDNAYKYSSEQKRIALRAFPRNGTVCFEVEDNGIGVPESEMQKVFRKFYQVDSRLARSRGGCGLGLSIVKFIVDAHRGSVDVQSRVGEGSTFTVAVPAVR